MSIHHQFLQDNSINLNTFPLDSPKTYLFTLDIFVNHGNEIIEIITLSETELGFRKAAEQSIRYSLKV